MTTPVSISTSGSGSSGTASRAASSSSSTGRVTSATPLGLVVGASGSVRGSAGAGTSAPSGCPGARTVTPPPRVGASPREAVSAAADASGSDVWTTRAETGIADSPAGTLCSSTLVPFGRSTSVRSIVAAPPAATATPIAVAVATFAAPPAKNTLSRRSSGQTWTPSAERPLTVVSPCASDRRARVRRAYVAGLLIPMREATSADERPCHSRMRSARRCASGIDASASPRPSRSSLSSASSPLAGNVSRSTPVTTALRAAVRFCTRQTFLAIVWSHANSCSGVTPRASARWAWRKVVWTASSASPRSRRAWMQYARMRLE